jgi:HSP20 family protein
MGSRPLLISAAEQEANNIMNGSFRFAGDLFPELSRLQQRLDEVFQTGGATTNIRELARGTFPAVNVGSSPDSIEVLAFAPGIDPKALQITVDKGLLVIAGERSRSAPADGESHNVYAQERFEGSFRRVISLPDDADPAKVDASLRDGLLRISVAKRESSKPRQIAVN